jgi:hypothetical protein
MTHTFAAILLATTLTLASSGAQAAVSVTCTGGKQLSSAIATAMTTAKPGASLEFRVTGNCVDDVVLPLGVQIYVIGVGSAATGGYGASLEPSTTSASALLLRGGWASVDNFYIKGKSGTTADDAVEVNGSGYLRIKNSKVVANGALQAVGSWSSALAIFNSVIIGDQESAVMVATNGYLTISADDGKSTNISYTGSHDGQAIGCYSGTISGWTTGSGTITIGPSTDTGIGARGCQAQIGLGSPKGSVRITQTKVGVIAKGGDILNLAGVDLSSNSDIAVEVSAGTVELDNTTINKPTAAAVGLSARRGGVIYFNNIYGTNSVSWTGSNTNFYNCRQGGHIYGVSGNPTGGAATSGCLDTTDTILK